MFQRVRRFRTSVALSFIVVFVPLLLLSSILQVRTAQSEIERRFAQSRAQTERNIIDTIRLVSIGINMIGKAFDDQMRLAFVPFLREYERSGGNPNRMNLSVLKASLGGTMDLYVIDERNVIVTTTYEKDKGLDFKKFPVFASRLDGIRRGGVFVPDTIGREVVTGMLRKYAYMPTPDQRFILELGLESMAFLPYMREIEPESLTRRLMEYNPALLSVTSYSIEGKLQDDIQAFVPEDIVAAVHEAVASGKPVERLDAPHGIITRYLYVDMRDLDIPSDMSYVVGLRYTTTELGEALTAIVRDQAIVVFVLVLLSFAVSFPFSARLARPIKSVSGALARIAGGDYSAMPVVASNLEEVRVLALDIRKLSDSVSDAMAIRDEALVEAEKMAALGRMVAGFAHDLNTPLGVAITAVSFIQERTQAMVESLGAGSMTKNDLTGYLTQSRESLDVLGTNVQRAADLVRDFKLIAVDQSGGEWRIFDVKAYIEMNLRSLAPVLKKARASATIQCPDGLKIESVPGAFSQILVNLVMNSALHGFDGNQHGTITIDVSEADGAVDLVYADDGRGMAPEVLANIFKPYVTTKKRQGGSGLGMYMIHQLITHALGGTIRCESEPGRGASFFIRLPAQPGQKDPPSS